MSSQIRILDPLYVFDDYEPQYQPKGPSWDCDLTQTATLGELMDSQIYGLLAFWLIRHGAAQDAVVRHNAHGGYRFIELDGTRYAERNTLITERPS